MVNKHNIGCRREVFFNEYNDFSSNVKYKPHLLSSNYTFHTCNILFVLRVLREQTTFLKTYGAHNGTKYIGLGRGPVQTVVH